MGFPFLDLLGFCKTWISIRTELRDKWQLSHEIGSIIHAEFFIIYRWRCLLALFFGRVLLAGALAGAFG